MENNELINENIDYSPYILNTCSFGNIINSNEIEVFVSGTNKTKTKSFLHYLTYDFNSKDESHKKETTLLFQTWNNTPSKTINYIIPIRINNSQNEPQNNLLSSGAFIFSSQLELLLNNNDDYNLYLIDDDLYIKPYIENDIIYGLILDIGLKIFDLAKKEIKSILYPGKKHVINDYFISSDNKNIIFTCEDRKIYVSYTIYSCSSLGQIFKSL